MAEQAPKRRITLRIIPEEILTQWRTKYAPNTIKSMSYLLNQINSDVFGKKLFDKNDYLTQYQKVCDYIRTLPIVKQKTTANSVRQALKCYDGDIEETPAMKAYYDLFGQVVEEMKDPEVNIPKTPPEYHWDDVVKTWEFLHGIVDKKDTKVRLNVYRDYIFFSLNVLIPPLRPQDWLNSRIVNIPKETTPEDYIETHKEEGESQNFLDLTGQRLILSDYKASWAHGIRIVPFDVIGHGHQVNDIIHKWLDMNEGKLTYLFQTKNGISVSETNCHLYLNSIPINGHHITSTEMRNMYVSGEIFDSHLPQDRRQYLAEIMGHTFRTQMQVYTKYSHDMKPH
jgi:hypothetical protein